MPKLFHPESEQSPIFITTSCYDKVNYFQNPRNAQIALNVIHKLRERKVWLIFEYVIMPNHVHLIAVPLKDVGYCMQEFKKSTARLINISENIRGRKIWLDEYHERVIRTEEEYLNKVEYIHFNPVKEKLVRKPEEFIFSSANPLSDTDRDKL